MKRQVIDGALDQRARLKRKRGLAGKITISVYVAGWRRRVFLDSPSHRTGGHRPPLQCGPKLKDAFLCGGTAASALKDRDLSLAISAIFKLSHITSN